MPDHRISRDTGGVFIISATPFGENGSIDFASIDRLVEFYIETGVAGITILGMMGEAPKLSLDETEQIVKRFCARVNGRAAIVVGVSNAGFDNLNHLSGVSMDQGAAGIMVAPMAGLDTDEKIYNYYAHLFEMIAGNTPVCYQDYPYSTKAPVSVSCLERMFTDFPDMVMLKHEDWPGLTKITKLREGHGSNRSPKMSILVGNGGLYLPQELARGVDGAMTGFAYPEMLVQVVAKFQGGDVDGAEDLFDAYLPLVRHEQQPGFGLAVRKEILRRRGAITSARTRAPGPTLTAVDQDELTRLIKRVEHNLQALGA